MQRYLETIEELSKSVYLHEGEYEKFTRILLQSAASTLECARCNAWLFKKKQSVLTSLLSYSSHTNEFHQEKSLSKKQLPNYFKFLSKNEFIVSHDALKEPMNTELIQHYLVPNTITSMIDVPLRSEGKMIGVLCFEHIIEPHLWTDSEQKFTQSLAQLLSLALETKKKKKYQLELERIIAQKEVLISEINHWVKNNMAVIVSLLNLQKQKTKDNYHALLFEDVKDKVFSMSMIQEQLHSNGRVDRINLGKYLSDLLVNLHNSYGQSKKVKLSIKVDKIGVDVSKAIPCGLIANEIITNSFKYAFNNGTATPKLALSLINKGDNVELTFKDNGSGFNPKSTQMGMGLELIKDLAEQIDGTIKCRSEKGVVLQLSFPLK